MATAYSAGWYKPRIMPQKRKRRKIPVGRPPLPMPDTPENVARTVLNTPLKKADEWQYLKDYKAGKQN